MNGWRTIVLQGQVSLTLKDGVLSIEGDYSAEVPIAQLRQVLILTSSVNLSSGLLCALASNHTDVVICDKRYNPAAEMIPLGLHAEAAGHIMDQMGWKAERRDEVWAQIVRMKICNQRRLLKSLGFNVPVLLREYAEAVKAGDTDNREGLAARIYFPMLFGRQFRRHANDGTNAALNYGYTILCSMFSRLLSVHGYHPGVGVHHRSRENPVNLSCDLMEPFRPAVDRIVYEANGGELDWELKKKLIAIPYSDSRVGDRHLKLENAAELFLLETMSAVQDGGLLPEVRFD